MYVPTTIVYQCIILSLGSVHCCTTDLFRRIVVWLQWQRYEFEDRSRTSDKETDVHSSDGMATFSDHASLMIKEQSLLNQPMRINNEVHCMSGSRSCDSDK